MARVAIVTGGTRGIGEAISVALKNQKAGQNLNALRELEWSSITPTRIAIRAATPYPATRNPPESRTSIMSR